MSVAVTAQQVALSAIHKKRAWTAVPIDGLRQAPSIYKVTVSATAIVPVAFMIPANIQLTRGCPRVDTPIIAHMPNIVDCQMDAIRQRLRTGQRQ